MSFSSKMHAEEHNKFNLCKNKSLWNGDIRLKLLLEAPLKTMSGAEVKGRKSQGKGKESKKWQRKGKESHRKWNLTWTLVIKCQSALNLSTVQQLTYALSESVCMCEAEITWAYVHLCVNEDLWYVRVSREKTIIVPQSASLPQTYAPSLSNQLKGMSSVCMCVYVS